MPLPSLIEMVPLDRPVRAEITVPGSKSITNRALILAALSHGETILRGALWSEDTQVMVECLQLLGYMVNVSEDPDEACNRTLTVYGRGSRIARGGTSSQPLELFVGNAGTAARFLSALVCLGEGVYRLHGVPRMHERPQSELFHALRELGYRVDTPNDRLPAVIHGGGHRPGQCEVSIEKSSQFASALILCARAGGWRIRVVGENAEESPYVAMTLELVKTFPFDGGAFRIEPDASSGSYFWGADWILWVQSGPNPELGQVTVRHWPRSGWQIDARYPEYRNLVELDQPLSRKLHLGDSIMTAIVKAPLNRAPLPLPSPRARGSSEPAAAVQLPSPIRFKDLGRLRLQETERVHALCRELRKCHVTIEEHEDDLVVHPGIQRPDEPIETYNDHRMAMCFAILGLKVPGIKIKNPVCVKKTFPNFFQKLAAPPPRGLGARILDATQAASPALDLKSLFAE